MDHFISIEKLQRQFPKLTLMQIRQKHKDIEHAEMVTLERIYFNPVARACESVFANKPTESGTEDTLGFAQYYWAELFISDQMSNGFSGELFTSEQAHRNWEFFRSYINEMIEYKEVIK